MRSSPPVARRSALLATVVAVGTAALLGGSVDLGAQGGPRGDVPERIVAIGDIHGAAGALRVLLRTLELVDEAGDWSGGETVLVQTGDFLDRGEASIEVAGWLRQLQEQAPASGGRVHVLMGNHEALNLLGNYSDVAPRQFERLADRRSEKRRRELCRGEVRIRKTRARAAGEKVPSTNLARNRCLADNPLGLIEYVELLGPGTPLGEWIRSLPGTMILGDTLFVHGGLSPEFADWSPEEIDRRLREEIEAVDRAREWLRDLGRASRTVRMRDAVAEARLLVEDEDRGRSRIPDPVRDLARFQGWLLVHPEGPLWYRGWSWPEEDATEAELERVLDARGVRRMVVGHTPQKGAEIVPRFGGRVFAIDTGMLTAVYRGAPSALEIRGDRVESVYLDRRVTLIPVTDDLSSGSPFREALGDVAVGSPSP